MMRIEKIRSETSGGAADATRSDAPVLFGVTGDLAYKMIFPALYALAKRGARNFPVVGVASPLWSLAQLHKRATESIRALGRIDHPSAPRHMLSRLHYVSGDYNDPARSLRWEMRSAMRGDWRTISLSHRRYLRQSSRRSAPQASIAMPA